MKGELLRQPPQGRWAGPGGGAAGGRSARIPRAAGSQGRTGSSAPPGQAAKRPAAEGRGQPRARGLPDRERASRAAPPRGRLGKRRCRPAPAAAVPQPAGRRYVQQGRSGPRGWPKPQEGGGLLPPRRQRPGGQADGTRQDPGERGAQAGPGAWRPRAEPALPHPRRGSPAQPALHALRGRCLLQQRCACR